MPNLCKLCQQPLEDSALGKWWTSVEEAFHCN